MAQLLKRATWPTQEERAMWSWSRQLFVSLNQIGGDFLRTRGKNRKWQNKQVRFSPSFICPSAEEEWSAAIFLLSWLTQPLTSAHILCSTLLGPHCGCLCVIWWMTPPRFNYCPSSVLLAVFEAASHMFHIFEPPSWTKCSEVPMLVAGRQRFCTRTAVKMLMSKLCFLVWQERIYGRDWMRLAKRNVNLLSLH